MSVEGVAAISAGAALGGAAITQLANFFLEQRRDREWYRRNLFEKRVDTLREMSLEARRLFFAVNNLSADDVGRRFAEADDWFSRNRVLLNQECQEEFLEFLNAVSIRDHGAEEANNVLARYNTLVEAHRRWAGHLLARPQSEGVTK